MSAAQASDAVGAAADFAARFASYWQAPSPQGLEALLAPDVLLVSPMMPTTRTLAEGQRVFAGLFELIPDLTGVVHRWGATEDGVLIEFTLSGTAGSRRVGWDAVDRFELRPDGLAGKRISYFDSTPLLAAFARNPRAWPALLRSRLRR